MGGKAQPNYQQAAVAQGEANEEVTRNQTYANRPTQYTPWGYTAWNPYQTTDPGTGEQVTAWEQTQGLTPELQDILNKQVAIQGGRSDIAGRLTGRLGAEFGNQMDWSGLSPMGEKPTEQYTVAEPDIENPYGTRQRAEDAMYSQAQSRLAPQFESRRAALETKMRNQGLGPGDAAWQSQMQGLDMQETDANNQAMWSAVGEGRQESGQMYDQLMGQQQNRFGQALSANQQNWQQAMGGSQYANQIRQQQMAEAMQQRGWSLNEINALLSGQQVGMPQMPNFNPASAAAPPPIYQAAADQGSANAAASPWAGLAGLGGSWLAGGGGNPFGP